MQDYRDKCPVTSQKGQFLCYGSSQDDGSWVAEVPALFGCYALMPTREATLAQLGNVFEMIAIVCIWDLQRNILGRCFVGTI
jgi:hypothetical protein